MPTIIGENDYLSSEVMNGYACYPATGKGLFIFVDLGDMTSPGTNVYLPFIVVP